MLYFNFYQMASQASQQGQQTGILGEPKVADDQKELRKVLGQIFDETDLKDDEDRKDLFIWQNEVAIVKTRRGSEKSAKRRLRMSCYTWLKR